MSIPEEELLQQTAKDQISRVRKLLDDPVDPKGEKREGVGQESVWNEVQKLVSIDTDSMGWQLGSWKDHKNYYYRTNREGVYYKEKRAYAGYTDIDPTIGYKILTREILRFGSDASTSLENPLNFIQYSPPRL